MTDNQAHSSPLAGFNRGEAYLDTLAEDMPEMTRLFAILDSGVTPNFLDIMRGISEMVAFYTDHDQISEDLELLEEKMSQKKCRFCS